MADDFTLMTTDSMTVMLNNEGCCVKHPHVVIRKKTSTGEVYQKESCEECDKEYAQQQAELREQRAELKRQLQELEQSGKQQKSKSMVSDASDEFATNTAPVPAPSPFAGPAPPPSNDREAYTAPGMLSLEGLAYQMNRMQQMQDWILNQKESELQMLRSKYEEQQRELMRKEVEMALLQERLKTMQESMTKELEAVKLASRRGSDSGKAIHIGELHVSVKENASPEELAVATEDAFQKRLEDENNHRKSNNQKAMTASVGAGMAGGAAAGAVTAAAMTDKTAAASAPISSSAAPTVASPAAAETVMATNDNKMKEESSMMKGAPVQMKDEEPPRKKEPPVYPDEDDGPELIDDEPVPAVKDVPKPAPVERQATPAYVAPVAAAAALGAGAAAVGAMTAVDEDQSGEEQSEERDDFDVNALGGKPSLISESTGTAERPGVPMQASVQSLKALPREKDLGGLDNNQNFPGVSRMKPGPLGDFPKELTVDPSNPPQVPLEEGVTIGTFSGGSSDVPDDMTYGQTVASSTYGEDRVKVTNRHVLDPYGDEGTYSGVVLASTGMPHGVGRMVYKDDGRTYEGDWRHGRWHGFGKATFANGDSFEGQYRFDQRHGRGKYNWNDGREYDGMFYEDKRQGKGTFRWPDGAVYIGEFNHGQREGHGKYVFADGGFYEGEWLDGRYEGYGVCKWSDGRTYDGEWKQGMAHGRGKETNANGTVRHDGQWIEDEPVRDGASEYAS